MFQKEKQGMSASVVSMLDRLEERIDRGKLDSKEAEKSIAKVAEATVKAKSIIDKMDFDSIDVEDIAKYSTPWAAWAKEGIFKDDPAFKKEVQKFLGMDDDLNRFVRQVWRTEVVNYLIGKLQASGRTDKAVVVEKMMAIQKVSEKEDEPLEALTGAMWLDPALREKGDRAKIAADMSKSDLGGVVYDYFKELAPVLVRIVVGGEFIEMPFELTKELKIKHLVPDGDRFYAQMSNGCQGNLVIIEKGVIQFNREQGQSLAHSSLDQSWGLPALFLKCFVESDLKAH